MTCFGLAASGCSRLLAAVRAFSSALALFARFGLVGSVIALVMMVFQAIAPILLGMLRPYVHATPSTGPQDAIRTVKAITDVL